MARRMTADNFHRRFGDTEIIREEIDNSLVGFTVLRRWPHGYSVFSIREFCHFGLFGVGLDGYGDFLRHDLT